MTPKVKFRFAPPSVGGHSLLKIVAFDFQGNSIPLENRYTFNGRFAPESGKPIQYEKVTNIAKGCYQDFKTALDWAQSLWDNLDKTNVAHGYIADADFPQPGRQIWKKFQVASLAKPPSQGFIFCMRMKLQNGTYLEIKSSGVVNEYTGELKQDWQSCLCDIQAQYTKWAAYNTAAAKTAPKGMVFGDGKNLHKDTRNFDLYRIDFNPQTMQFTSRKRGGAALKIHSEAVQKRAQNTEELISNYLA